MFGDFGYTQDVVLGSTKTLLEKGDAALSRSIPLAFGTIQTHEPDCVGGFIWVFFCQSKRIAGSSLVRRFHSPDTHCQFH